MLWYSKFIYSKNILSDGRLSVSAVTRQRERRLPCRLGSRVGLGSMLGSRVSRLRSRPSLRARLVVRLYVETSACTS